MLHRQRGRIAREGGDFMAGWGVAYHDILSVREDSAALVGYVFAGYNSRGRAER